MDFPTLIASVGVGLLLIGFFLNVFRFVNENSFIYIFLNITGAAISCYASYLIQFVPFIILEGTWALVALIVLIKKVI
jgi:hypothetical protein